MVLAGNFCGWFWRAVFAYCDGVGITPTESVEGAANEGVPKRPRAMDGALVEALWQESEAASWGLERDDFSRILEETGAAQNFGLDDGADASRLQQADYFRALRLGDLVLARACAAGNDRAWERFVAIYREPLVRAAIAITGNDTLGRELADQLYGELLWADDAGWRAAVSAGVVSRQGIADWLAEDHAGAAACGPLSPQTPRADRWRSLILRRRRQRLRNPAAELTVLEKAVEGALKSCEAEDGCCLRLIIWMGERCARLRGCCMCMRQR